MERNSGGAAAPRAVVVSLGVALLFAAGLSRATFAGGSGASHAAAADRGEPAGGDGEARGDGGEDEWEGRIIESRAVWFRETHKGPDGVIPFRARDRARAELRQNLAQGKMMSFTPDVPGTRWVSVGPDAMLWGTTPYSGRVTALAPHPARPDTVYVGTAQGGVWKTTDAGASWSPLTDDQASLAIGSLAIDPSNPDRIYAGTGEPYEGCGVYFGSGILRTEDAGAHWSLLGESVFGGTSVSKIVVHPTNPTTLWAANAQGFAGFICAADPGPLTYGVRRSVDGGNTWTLVLGSAQTGQPSYTYDLVMHPTNPSVLYAAVGGSGVWKTTDGGGSWTKLAGGLPTADLGRVDLAIHPDSPQTLYAVFEKASTNHHLGTWKSVNGGSNWSPLPRVPAGGTCMLWSFDDICTYSALPALGWCNYALTVEVAPGSTVLLGGVGLWRSVDGGSSWIDSCSTEMHVDHHAVAFDTAGRIWVGGDGGVFRSDDGGATFADLNPGLVTAQFYPGASLHPTRRNFALGGTQDNGTFHYSGARQWTKVQTGDGGFTAVDGGSPDTTWYVSAQYLALYKTTDGGATVAPAMNGLTDAGTLYAAFIAPFAICPANPSVLVAGSDNVWKTTDGAALWSSNSPDPLVGLLQTIAAVAFAPTDATCRTVFLGMSSSRVYRTTVGGGLTGWTNISTGLPARGVSDIAVHPADGNIVYATVSGFGTPHVYRTTNALSPSPLWTAIGAGLPDAPANAVLLDPDDPSILYIGTDLGIFRSPDAGATWSLFMEGHPNVAVYDLAADASTGTIMSFTFGRGAWRLENCAVTCPPVGDTLHVGMSEATAQLAWGAVACTNLSHYEVHGSTSYAAAFPDEWVLLGKPEAPSFTDALESPWVAYRIRAADRCGRPSAQ